MLTTPFNIFSADPVKPVRPSRANRHPVTAPAPSEPAAALPDTIPLNAPVSLPAAVVEDVLSVSGDSVTLTPVDTVSILNAATDPMLFDDGVVADSLQASGKKVFVPDPIKAVWYSALCPGLGQIYNRRYWKLPIIVGGYLGLAYATNWNNNMLRDYTVELVPRVGNHIIHLGKLPESSQRQQRKQLVTEFTNKKMDRLEKFYRYGLSQAGWNKYSYINLEFDNQIICKKRTLKR